MLLAIAGIESLWTNCNQSGGGPGRGYFQIDPITCDDVANNYVTAPMTRKICAALNIPPDRIYNDLIDNPLLQVFVARADLWCDPRPLPAYGEAHAAWLAYDSTWRPGEPHPALWDAIYTEALAADRSGGITGC